MKRNQVFRIKWGWAIVASAIILLLNIAYAIWGYPNNKTEILTVISGWVSGIATFLIGVIAFVQNKKYKTDSDESLEKQYQFETAKLILGSRTTFIQDVKVRLRELINECDCNELLYKVKEIASLNNPTIKTVQQNHLEIEVDYFYESLSNKCNQLVDMIYGDKINSKEKYAITDAIDKYAKICDQYRGSSYKVIGEYVLPVYNELVKVTSDYFKFIDGDIHSSIERIRDNNYIVEHYSANEQKRGG